MRKLWFHKLHLMIGSWCPFVIGFVESIFAFDQTILISLTLDFKFECVMINIWMRMFITLPYPPFTFGEECFGLWYISWFRPLPKSVKSLMVSREVLNNICIYFIKIISNFMYFKIIYFLYKIEKKKTQELEKVCRSWNYLRENLMLNS